MALGGRCRGQGPLRAWDRETCVAVGVLTCSDQSLSAQGTPEMPPTTLGRGCQARMPTKDSPQADQGRQGAWTGCPALSPPSAPYPSCDKPRTCLQLAPFLWKGLCPRPRVPLRPGVRDLRADGVGGGRVGQVCVSTGSPLRCPWCQQLQGPGLQWVGIAHVDEGSGRPHQSQSPLCRPGGRGVRHPGPHSAPSPLHDSLPKRG